MTPPKCLIELLKCLGRINLEWVGEFCEKPSEEMVENVKNPLKITFSFKIMVCCSMPCQIIFLKVNLLHFFVSSVTYLNRRVVKYILPFSFHCTHAMIFSIELARVPL